MSKGRFCMHINRKQLGVYLYVTVSSSDILFFNSKFFYFTFPESKGTLKKAENQGEFQSSQNLSSPLQYRIHLNSY